MSSQFHHVIKWLSFVVDPGPKHSMHDIYIYIMPTLTPFFQPSQLIGKYVGYL